jgi:serine/threonine protein kinase
MNEIITPESTEAGSQTQRDQRARLPNGRFRSTVKASALAAVGQSTTLNIGGVLKDRYLIESRLGGSRTVFKATDRFQRDEAKRRVAIKVVQESGTSRPERLSSLRREFHLTQSLCHDTIVKVHELGQAGDVAFLTMEFVEGRLLSEVIKLYAPRHIPRPDAWHILRDLSAGLAHAHSRNAVHGDLSPQNVMVTRTGSVRILGFGASRPCNDPREDIYSLACLAYELLTGSHPFKRGQADRARNRRPPVERPPGLSQHQWQTLRMGLSPDRERRPLSASEWFASLEAGQASTRSLLAGCNMQVGHLSENKKPLPSWIVVPIICTLVALSILSSIHGRPPITHPAVDSGRPISADSSKHADYAVPNDVGTRIAPAVAAAAAPAAASAPAAAPTAADSAAQSSTPSPPSKPVMVGAERGDADLVSRAAGGIVLPRRTYSVPPRQDFVEIRIRRSAGSAGDARFNWWTEAASAQPGTDFVPQEPVTRDFASGTRTASLFVKVLPNDSRKRPEVFYVDVADLSNGNHPPPIERVAVALAAAR